MLDLIDQLDALAARSNSRDANRLPLHEFYRELNRIYAEACRRTGDTAHIMPGSGIPAPASEPTQDDREDALAFWMIAKTKAENPEPGRVYTTEQAFAEFEDEIGPYDPDEDIDLGPGWVEGPT